MTFESIQVGLYILIRTMEWNSNPRTFLPVKGLIDCTIAQPAALASSEQHLKVIQPKSNKPPNTKVSSNWTRYNISNKAILCIFPSHQNYHISRQFALRGNPVRWQEDLVHGGVLCKRKRKSTENPIRISPWTKLYTNKMRSLALSPDPLPLPFNHRPPSLILRTCTFYRIVALCQVARLEDR